MRVRNWLYYPSGTPALLRPDILWLKANDPDGTGIPPAAGPMSSVYDFSTSAGSFAGTGAGGPTYDGSGQWAFVPATNNAFSRTNIALPFDYSHVFIVATLNKLVTADFVFDSGTSGTISRYFMACEATGVRIERETGGSVGIGAGSYTNGGTYLVTGVFAGASSLIRLNAGAVASSSGTITATSSPNYNPTFGTSVVSTNYFPGIMREMMMYSTANVPSSGQRTAIETYLMTKWGL